ncbi:MAG: DUF2244 domain-containing protein [Alphaproteobacteria bacterium]|nr:DUF2244 domain-containing protein [Alphaproteobacteria bacterium]
MHTKTTTTPLLAAELTPHRALTKRDGWLLTGLSALLFVAPWLLLVPVALELVAALMVLAGATIALVLTLRGKGRRRERVTVWADQIEWQSTDRRGARTLRRFQPTAVRLLLTRDANEKTTAIRLRQGEDELVVGAFLSVEDRSSFAKALGTALRRARADQR